MYIALATTLLASSLSAPALAQPRPCLDARARGRAPNASASLSSDLQAGLSGRLSGAIAGSVLAALPPVPGDAELRQALDLRARARVSLDAGRLTAALPSLEQAYSLTHDVTLLGDLGVALQAAGRLDEAWLALHRYRHLAFSAYLTNRARIDAALAALTPRLGGLAIDASAPGAMVYVRGELAGALPLSAPIYLAPGDVTVTVRAPGRAEARVNAQLDVGAVARARAELVGSLAVSPAAWLPFFPTDAALDQAAGLIASARASIAAGRVREALPSLEQAFALTHDVTLLGDLGLALQAAGRLDEAWSALHRVRWQAPGIYAAAQARIDAALGALRAQLGGVQIDGEVPGARVYLRDQLVATLPVGQPIFAAPGDVDLVVRAPGRIDARIRARVAVGAVARVRAELPSLEGGELRAVSGLATPAANVDVTAPNVSAPAPSGPGLGTVLLVGGLGVATVGLAAVGIGGSIWHGNIEGSLQASCPMGSTNPVCTGLRSNLDTSNWLQGVGYVVGGVVLVAGTIVAIVVLNRPRVETPECGERAANERALHRVRTRRGVSFGCNPWLGNGQGGLGCFGTF